MQDVQEYSDSIERRFAGRQITWEQYVAHQVELRAMAVEAQAWRIVETIDLWAAELDAESPDLPSVAAQVNPAASRIYTHRYDTLGAYYVDQEPSSTVTGLVYENVREALKAARIRIDGMLAAGWVILAMGDSVACHGWQAELMHPAAGEVHVIWLDAANI